MSAELFVYLDSPPDLPELRQVLGVLGLNYKHTLPADDRWDYPMHVFGCDDLRVVYHAGSPLASESLIDSRVIHGGDSAELRLQLVMAAIVRRFGGTIHHPRAMRGSTQLAGEELVRAR